jgi:plastocyanin
MRTAVIIVVVIVVLGGGYLLLSNKNTQQTATPITNTTSPTSSPSEQISTTMENTKQTTVTLTSSGFEPQTVTIKAGDKVVWVNNSGDAATVNSDPHPVHTDYPPLNLGQFQNGDKLELVFPKAGTYKYHNHVNPQMRGTVVVE